jgi:hypothetical protein
MSSQSSRPGGDQPAVDMQPARGKQADDPGSHPAVEAGKIGPMAAHLPRDGSDEILRHLIHRTPESGEVRGGVTVGAATNCERPAGKWREGIVKRIKRVPEPMERVRHANLPGLLRAVCRRRSQRYHALWPRVIEDDRRTCAPRQRGPDYRPGSGRAFPVATSALRTGASGGDLGLQDGRRRLVEVAH